MLKCRLIPVLLLQNGMLVRSEGFNTHQIIGNPVHEVERFNEWNVDEIVYLNISRNEDHDLRRQDAKVRDLSSLESILEAVSRRCFMPLAWGGRLRTLADVTFVLTHGADKAVLNTAAYREPELITQAANSFGSQAVIVSIDVRRTPQGHEVCLDGGRFPTGTLVEAWAAEAERRGAGEILLQSIDQDGMAEGYDLELIRLVSQTVSIPVIACSGVGRFEDYAAGVKAGATAVAAANIWHFKELADRAGKRAMARAGIAVRQSIEEK